jgi:hypothetical protein
LKLKEPSSGEREAEAPAEGGDRVGWDETTGAEGEGGIWSLIDLEGDIRPEGIDTEEDVVDVEDGVEY